MSEFFLWLLFFITYVIGFLAGYWLYRSERTEERLDGSFIPTGSSIQKKLKDASKAFTKQEIPTGVIKPKSAHELYLKKLPLDKQEGLKAMKETLDQIPELQEHKKRLEAEKRLLREIYGSKI